MEPLLLFANAVVYWRVLASLAIGVVIAVLAHNLFPHLPDGGLVLIACTGVGLGLHWQGRAEQGLGIREKTEPIVLSRPVECLSLWIFGAIYGGLLAGVLGSQIGAVFAIILSVAVVAIWHDYKASQRTTAYYTYAAVTMVTGFGSLVLFIHYARPSF